MLNNLYYQDEAIRETFRFSMFVRIFKRAYRHKKEFWGSIVIELFTSAVSLVPGLLYSLVVGLVFPESGELRGDFFACAAVVTGALAVVWVAQVIGYYFEVLIPNKFTSLVCAGLREEFFTHVTKLSFRYFDTHATGKILVRATNYIDELAELFSQLFYSLLYFACSILVGCVLLVALDWRVGGAVVLSLIPFTAAMLALGRAVHVRAGRDRNKNSNYTAFVAENINGAEVVRSYNRGALNGKAAQELYDEYAKAFMRTTHVREAFFPLAHGFTKAACVIIAYGVSLFLLLNGFALPLATLVAISSTLDEVTGSLGDVCTSISDVFTLTTNLERIYDTIDTPVEICDEEGAVPLEHCRGDVAFNHVDFSYIEGIPVLKDFTLHADAGQTVAIVGATGSGKTTVVNLLSRFYDVNGGTVTIDGKDVKEYTLRSLRENVGAMMQDTYLFSGTVMENIRFARPQASDEECIAAAKAAYADWFIQRLPQGYETFLSENSALSGGERQLLSFARLILADPKMIVLDEATSHIDTQTEREVQNSLKTLLKGRTSFVIAHRLSTIRGADKIVFIDEGMIKEQGTHEELMAMNGYYAKMIRSATV